MSPTHRCKASDIPVSVLRKFEAVELQTPFGNWIMPLADFNEGFIEATADDYSDLDDGGLTR